MGFFCEYNVRRSGKERKGNLRVVAPSLSIAHAVTGESVVADKFPPTPTCAGADSMTGRTARALPSAVNR